MIESLLQNNKIPLHLSSLKALHGGVELFLSFQFGGNEQKIDSSESAEERSPEFISSCGESI